MNALFLSVVNMSLTASILGAVVFALRILLKRRLPRWTFYLLWALVLARLLLPVSFSSPVSAYNALPAARAIPASSGSRAASIEFLGDSGESVDFLTLQLPYESSGASSGKAPGQTRIAPAKISIFTIMSTVWACGFFLLLAYGIGCYIYTTAKIHRASRLEHTPEIDAVFKRVGIRAKRVRIYQSSLFASPVVCGLIRPKLVLSELVDDQELAHVVAHELTHIRRRDNLYKALATLALYIHWFNPLVWMFYRWYVTDMETSCDEAVVTSCVCERSSYAYALVNMAAKNKNAFTGGFLAFGECALKERVIAIMNVQKNTVILTLLCVAIIGGFAIIFLTNPQQKTLPDTAPASSAASSAAENPQAALELADLTTARALLDALDPAALISVEITGCTVTPQDFEAVTNAVKAFKLEAWSGLQKPGASSIEFYRSDGTMLQLSYNGDRLLLTQYGLRASEDKTYTCRVITQSMDEYRQLVKSLETPQISTAPPAPAPAPAVTPAPEQTKKPDQTKDEEGGAAGDKTQNNTDDYDEFPALLEDNPPCLRIFPDDVTSITLVDWKTHTACPITAKKDIRRLLAALNTLTVEENLALTPNSDQLRLLRIRLTDGEKYDYWCYSNVMTCDDMQLARFPQLDGLYDTFYSFEQAFYNAQKSVAEWLGYMNPYKITAMTIERLDSDENVEDELFFDAQSSEREREAIMRIATGLQSVTVLPDSVQSCAKSSIRVPRTENRMYNIYLEFESGRENYNVRLMDTGRLIITVDSLDYALLYDTTGDGTLSTLIANLDAVVYGS